MKRLPCRLIASALLLLTGQVAVRAAAVDLDWITRYCNEEIEFSRLSEQPRMLRNISNSRMVDAPDYLDDAFYLQRRTNMSLCPELEGIGEIAQDWLRPNRVTLANDAVVFVAIREEFYEGAGTVLVDAGWRPVTATISLAYYQDPAELILYAGLVPAGDLHLSGAGVDLLRSTTTTNTSLHHYYFFQDPDTFSAEFLARLNPVNVPEPASILLAACGGLALLLFKRRSTSALAVRV